MTLGLPCARVTAPVTERLIGRSMAAGEVALPAMALLAEAVEHNLQLIAALARREAVLLPPHVKTTTG